MSFGIVAFEPTPTACIDSLADCKTLVIGQLMSLEDTEHYHQIRSFVVCLSAAATVLDCLLADCFVIALVPL